MIIDLASRPEFQNNRNEEFQKLYDWIISLKTEEGGFMMQRHGGCKRGEHFIL
jgi:hypothetical protein